MKQTVKRTGIAALAAAIVIALAACATAPQIESGDFTYRETETGITITGYTGPGGDVIIPAEIDGKPVTAIGNNAFNKKNLTSVVIPNRVASIGNSSFANNQLTDVVIPNSVTAIGSLAFANNQLKTATLPNGVTEVKLVSQSGNGPTTWNYQIASSATKIASTAFRSVGNSHTHINWTEGGLTFGDFYYIETDTGIAIGYDGSGGDVVIPAEINGKPVTSIRPRSFGGKGLTSVVIPNSVIEIGEDAFSINQLTSVTIGSSVISIGNRAFGLNQQLTSVVIPDSVISIGNSAFEFSQLTSVTIGSSVTSIGDSAFANNQLTGVTIPDSVTSIGESAFANNQLTGVTIPDSVTSIGDGAFYNNLLESVTIGSGITSIGNWTFGGTVEKGTFIDSVTIGANVTVANYAFAYPVSTADLSAGVAILGFAEGYNAANKAAGTYALVRTPNPGGGYTMNSNSAWRRQ